MEFFIEKKVYYHDTDSGGVVYYANYLKFMEEARSEYCRQRGFNIGEWAQKGIVFMVAHVEIDYKAPAQYGNTLKVTVAVENIGESSVNFRQEVRIADKLLVKAGIVWVCVGKDFKTLSLPQEVRAALEERR